VFRGEYNALSRVHAGACISQRNTSSHAHNLIWKDRVRPILEPVNFFFNLQVFGPYLAFLCLCEKQTLNKKWSVIKGVAESMRNAICPGVWNGLTVAA
jgi:hypothetical protein